MDAQVTPGGVRRLLDSGAEPERIARLLVATGAWSEAGALDIVSTLSTDSSRLASDVMVGAEIGLTTVGRGDAALIR